MQDLHRKQYYQDLTNSDLVYYNDYYEMLRIKEYTFHKKQLFMKKKAIIVRITINEYMYSNNNQEVLRVNAECAWRDLRRSLDS